MNDAYGRGAPDHPDEDELVRTVDASPALRQLLAAASAPPSAAELRGRSRALAGFRAMQLPRWTEAGRGIGAGRAAGGHRAAVRLTLACTAVLVLLGGVAANAAADELPTALRNAVAGLFTDLAPSGDSPSPVGTPSEHPLQPNPGRTGPTRSPAG